MESNFVCIKTAISFPGPVFFFFGFPERVAPLLFDTQGRNFFLYCSARMLAWKTVCCMVR